MIEFRCPVMAKRAIPRRECVFFLVVVVFFPSGPALALAVRPKNSRTTSLWPLLIGRPANDRMQFKCSAVSRRCAPVGPGSVVTCAHLFDFYFTRVFYHSGREGYPRVVNLKNGNFFTKKRHSKPWQSGKTRKLVESTIEPNKSHKYLVKER